MDRFDDDRIVGSSVHADRDLDQDPARGRRVHGERGLRVVDRDALDQLGRGQVLGGSLGGRGGGHGGHREHCPEDDRQ